MRASEFDWLLMNHREMLPANSTYYLKRDEALKRLRDLTGQDFGDDDVAWAHYGQEKDLCLIRWEEHLGKGLDRRVKPGGSPGAV